MYLCGNIVLNMGCFLLGLLLGALFLTVIIRYAKKEASQLQEKLEQEEREEE